MKIECTHHVDAGEQDADGFYDYYYEYDLYHFSLDAFKLTVRSYSDTSDQASVLRIEEAGKVRGLQYADLKRPLLQQAVAYLQAHGKSEVRWFNPKYARYDPI